jgi:hypothetical protein
MVTHSMILAKVSLSDTFAKIINEGEPPPTAHERPALRRTQLGRPVGIGQQGAEGEFGRTDQ